MIYKLTWLQVVKEIDLVEIIVKQAIARAKDSRISRDDFLNAAAQFTRYGVFTPLEADIIFHFAANQESSRLRLGDFNQLFDAKWEARSQAEDLKPSLFHDLGKAIYNFGLGGIAGGLGATAVYPIDLVCPSCCPLDRRLMVCDRSGKDSHAKSKK